MRPKHRNQPPIVRLYTATEGDGLRKINERQGARSIDSIISHAWLDDVAVRQKSIEKVSNLYYLPLWLLFGNYRYLITFVPQEATFTLCHD